MTLFHVEEGLRRITGPARAAQDQLERVDASGRCRGLRAPPGSGLLT